jgi:ferritin
MVSESIQNAINDQIKNELNSAYLYLAMAAYCESVNLRGSATWFRVQASEEQGHAMKLFGYLNDRGGRVILQAIPQPPAEFKSLLGAFQQALEHEKAVTAMIDGLFDLAVSEKDVATQVLLQWFITEQVEEEKTASDIVAQLEMVGDRGSSILYLDHQLGHRGK